MGFPKPCIECGQLTKKSRCEYHQGLIDARVNAYKATRQHYKGDYAQRAKAVRDSATNCWICGDGPRPHDPWQADHLYPADPNSPLLPAHRSCNARRGNKPIYTPPSP